VRTKDRTAASALEVVYRAEGNRLWWAVLAYAGDRDVASDAVAEAFAQALRRGSGIEDPAAWVWRASFRIAAGELQRRRRFHDEVTVTQSPTPVGLFTALDELSRNQRACVVLHYYAGYKLREIGEILGISKATVGVHLTRGRRRLRAILEGPDG
jgi:RNA polymerase sigma-70 factor, ECF subfamily